MCRPILALLSSLLSLIFLGTQAAPYAAAQQAAAPLDRLPAEVNARSGSDLRPAILDAVSTADDHTQLSNWYSGRILSNGEWLSLSQTEQLASQNEKLADYIQRRNASDDSAIAHQKLARWCHKQGLADLARMHWMHVLRFSPNDKRALAALDLQWVDGYLLSSAERKQYDQQLKEFADLQKMWKSKLRHLRRDLQHGSPEEQLAAEQELEQIRDPAAVPVLLEEFAGENEEPPVVTKLHTQATRALVNIDGPASTEALASLAVGSPYELVRYMASEGLKSRPYTDYVPWLLSEMQMPIEAAAKVQEIGSNIVTTYSYFQEGPANQRYEREYSSSRQVPVNKYIGVNFYRQSVIPGRTIPGKYVPAAQCGGHIVPAHQTPSIRISATLKTEYDHTAYGDNPFYAGVRDQTADTSQYLADQQIDVVGQQNQAIEANNQEIAIVLTDLTGQQLPPTPKSWWNWWAEYLAEHPDQATVGARQQLSMALLNQEARGLARGTWVWTNLGRKPIEQVLHGDYVLAQDPQTGELAYKVVLAITYPQQLTVDKITLGEDAIHCAAGQVAWVTGRGWQLAAKLSTQDSLHGVTDEASITSKAEAFTIDSYDLVVDDFHTYFIGEKGILVHDASPVNPTAAALPGISPAVFADAMGQ